MTYCTICGNKLVDKKIENNLRPYCPQCGKVVYVDPKVAVVVLILKNNSLLLVKRDIEPHFGKWSFPSGYVDRGEMVEKAAIREVIEETNLKIKLDKLQGVYSGKGPVVLVVYQASPLSPRASKGDEVSAVKWFDLDDLPNLPFSYDAQIMKDLNNNLSN
jgi:ADP-ribose pyrophosphatase YjhB (NUDIX family)